MDCCAVVADEPQAEFIYEHVEGAKAMAGTRVGYVAIHDDVGNIRGQSEELQKEPARPAVMASRLVQGCNELGVHLLGVVNHKLWCCQLCEPVPHTHVHSGRSPRVVEEAQEVDGLAVLPGDGTQTSPAPKFVLARFGQPLAKFLGVVLVAWHDGAPYQDSQFILQVEDCDGVVKTIHEQHVVLVGDM